MTSLQQTIKAIVRPGEESGYVAECVEIAVVTQGHTLDETVANLREAVSLHLEDEDPATFGLRPNPTLILTLELEPCMPGLRRLSGREVIAILQRFGFAPVEAVYYCLDREEFGDRYVSTNRANS
jgi:predicted RNase H-like HicB family nuclease